MWKLLTNTNCIFWNQQDLFTARFAKVYIKLIQQSYFVTYSDKMSKLKMVLAFISNKPNYD